MAHFVGRVTKATSVCVVDALLSTSCAISVRCACSFDRAVHARLRLLHLAYMPAGAVPGDTAMISASTARAAIRD